MGQSRCVLKSWFKGGAQKKDFVIVSQAESPEQSFVCGPGYLMRVTHPSKLHKVTPSLLQNFKEKLLCLTFVRHILYRCPVCISW